VWWIPDSSAVVSVLPLVISLTAGCAAETQGEAPTDVAISVESKPTIFGGARDDAAQRSSVVALKVARGNAFELCSGTLVAKNVVLTARHCVAKSVTTSVSCDEDGKSTNGNHVDGNQAPSSVAVYVGASPKFSQKADAAGRSIVSPKGDQLCDTDIALVVLDKAIEDVSPLAVRLAESVNVGETIRSIGYGQNDKKIPIGTRFQKEGVSVLAMGRGISESKTALGRHEFEVGRSICQGDSGGPAISEGTGAVIGVVSRGGECDADFGHIYTTTAGWSELFDEAFAIAGGAPVLESGTPTVASDLPPAGDTARAAATEPRADGGCSAAGAAGTAARAPGESRALGLALAVLGLVIGRGRRRRAMSK
jgi:V8-like Glu-specific endopeptidase